MSQASKNINISSADASFYTDLATAVAVGAASGGLTPHQQETTLTEGQDTILVTANAGVLPASDSAILLCWDNGVVAQSGYTIDRISSPNELVLDTPVEVGQTIIFTLLIFV